ncbi:MAG: 3,4-dehydroadipyl-CoA semialdehyde dehydrogenase [Candidatus Eisenbacteria bacterium]
MVTLESYISGSWYRASSGFRPLLDPSTEAEIAQASSEGADMNAACRFARDVGGPALRGLGLAERGAILSAMSKALVEVREELLDLSVESTGVTRRDAKFDIDGATGTLAFYAHLAKGLGDARFLHDGAGDALGRSARFYGQHVFVPRHGVAVLIDAFNFPAWGFAEKLACAFLAGMPVLIKPATSTAWVTERCVRILVDAGIVPAGTLSFIAGSAGDLLSHLGPQDVLAFTGSAATGLELKSHERILAEGVRVNIEADSLNAAVLAPDVVAGSDVYSLFFREVVREMTQKSGQKCTAVRRILVPEGRMEEIRDELASRLGDVVVGNPRDESVTMGPLTTADQLADTLEGIALMAASGAEVVRGGAARVDGRGAPEGKGYYVDATLLAVSSAEQVPAVHSREIFGPVATLVPYDGDAETAARIIALGQGSLVTSVYSDDEDWVGSLLPTTAAWNGRLYLASKKMAEQAPGSGLVLPLSKHGGPGRAGGGEELGGLRGVQLYMNRVALQGSKTMIDRLVGKPSEDS